ncbi:chemotaxis protein R [Paenibacillus sp. J31TS4]|uniref:CheR family methyltransferase n=1 Tax=Paenibacillus sp. J31TS4 TaxID=2807195 RepID=UPI001B074FD2|nr:protein-glutamate O-methyltransferase CheR [Paenibacillus sp. J31TS4]GIP38226.1 chemotaxis protein R [Paenibacillus sp. J31TS4]
MRGKPKEEREAVELDLLMEGIRRVYGYDLREYERASVSRRVQSHLQATGTRSITALLEKILHDPEEMKTFLGNLLVGVTTMFRDPDLFRAIRETVVPLLHTYPSVRIWHAGCATGEEVYSMAILLWEEGVLDKTHIYATDISEASLTRARRGTFPLRKLSEYARHYREAGGQGDFASYCEIEDDTVTFAPFLGRQLVFSEHNLATDTSFNEFHVIFCRNVLIYFSQSLQDRVHDLFYQSLPLLGFLILGDKESIRFSKHEDCYEPWSGQEKLYRKLR